MSQNTQSALFIFNKAPYGSQSSRELLDITLMTSAFELPITVIFTGDGVLQLKTEQTPEVLSMKNHSPTFKALELYGVETVLIDKASIETRNLEPSQLMDVARIVEHSEIQKAIAQADSVTLL